MPLYDLMLLLDPGVPSDRQESILRDVQTQLDSGGSVVGSYDWGTRRMTFEIDHRPEAAYHLFQFETADGGALLEQVDHSLKIMDGVLRHRIIRLKDGSPPPPVPSPDRRYGDYDAESPAAPEAGQPTDTPAAPETAAVPEPTAATAEPAAPAEEAPPAPAETTPPSPDVDAEQEAGPAGGGGDDEAPSGPTAA